MEISIAIATVELGEGIHANCRLQITTPREPQESTNSKPDLSDLSSMLKDRWKGISVAQSKPEALRAGQIRSFRISKLDHDTRTVDVELV